MGRNGIVKYTKPNKYTFHLPVVLYWEVSRDPLPNFPQTAQGPKPGDAWAPS